MIARVIVNVPSSNTDFEYDYLIPENICDFAKIGSRVRVKFGKADREVMGFILDLRDETDYSGQIKEIEEIVDYEPVLTKEQIELAKFIKEDAVCPLIRILNMMIPDGLKLKTHKYLKIVNYQEIYPSIIDLFKESDLIIYSKSFKEYDNKIAKEIKKGNIKCFYEAKTETKPKMVNKYIINENYTYMHFNELRSKIQKDFLEAIHNEIPLTNIELIDKYGVSLYQINSLFKKGFLKRIEEKESRVRVRTIPVNKKIRISNNDEILKFLNQVDVATNPMLLIPSSQNNQNEIIIQLVNEIQKKKQNIVIIVPEILTSYKIENLIRQNTGLSVAVINSNLSSGELLDTYDEIKNDSYSVIVTTSKGALLPYQNVGLYLMIDAESDNYFNDQSPRYDLRKVIEYASKLTNSKVVMMQYVPTLIDYTYGLKGLYNIYEMKKEKHQFNVQLIDLKDDLKKGNNTLFSFELINRLKINKAKGNKAILVINNKGYSSYVTCRSCGTTIKCPKCSISLQYNKKKEILMCPSCAYKQDYTGVCPNCNSTNLKLGGYGMEQVKEDLELKLPGFNYAVLDTTNFELFSMINSDLEDGTIDVIITSDNFLKSIDLENIGLVAILNIDTTSKSNCYDANERAYRALANAALKLNNDQESNLIVQTYGDVEQYFKDFLLNDYHEFFKNEITIRKILKYEPFFYVNRIIVKGKYETIFKEANEIKNALKAELYNELFIMGPTYNYQYQGVQIIIKHKIKDISEVYMRIYQKYQTTDTTVIIDKYPKYI